MVKISSIDDLKLVAASLHDARFTADEIDFNAAAQTFALKCWTIDEKPRAFTFSSSWRAYQLLFSGVVDCKVNFKERVRYYELATVRFDQHNSRVDLVTHYAIELRLQVAELSGNLLETGETRQSWE